MKDGECISRPVGKDPVEAIEATGPGRSCGKGGWEGRRSQHMEAPPSQAVCQEDAASLVSRAGAILNEQREPAVQMAKAQPSGSEVPTTSLISLLNEFQTCPSLLNVCLHCRFLTIFFFRPHIRYPPPLSSNFDLSVRGISYSPSCI